MNIEYIYEKEYKTAPARATQAALSAARLADVPNALLHELEEAALALNREAALSIISRIAGQDPELAAGLRGFVDNFQMTELGDLLEEANVHVNRT